MNDERFRRGDRVDYNNSHDPNNPRPNGSVGRIKRVIVTRRYVIEWEDGSNGSNGIDNSEPFAANELIALLETA